MSVESTRDKDQLTLKLNNGDLREFDRVMEKWHFKDHQSLMRFAISLLVLNENNFFSVKIDNQHRDVIPTSDLIKEN
jgi:hypothetical protein